MELCPVCVQTFQAPLCILVCVSAQEETFSNLRECM